MALSSASDPVSLVQQKCLRYRALTELITPDAADEAIDFIWPKVSEALSEAMATRSASLADLNSKLSLLLDSVDETDTETRRLLTLLQVDFEAFLKEAH